MPQKCERRCIPDRCLSDEWFRRKAVANLVKALSIDRAATLKRLRLESGTVARSLSLAEAELARAAR